MTPAVDRRTEATVTGSRTPSRDNLAITVDDGDQETVVRLSGRINVDSSPDLRDRLRGILSGKPLPRSIAVDFAGVSYLETSGVATLIEALRIARLQQIVFRLQGLGGAVLKLFEVTGVLALFEPGGGERKVL
jgi:anti-sigma B factor antagonist